MNCKPSPSTTIVGGDGGGRANLQELDSLTVSQAYSQSWERECLDLTELARRRWIENWEIRRLAKHFGISATAVKERLRSIKKNPGRAAIP